jgi:hypothetical protein
VIGFSSNLNEFVKHKCIRSKGFHKNVFKEANDMRVKFEDLIAKLPGPATRMWPNGVWFAPAFSSDTLSIQLYTPKTSSYTPPNGVNIIYITIRGRSDISIAGRLHEMQLGDVMTVDADAQHEFVNFTSDFAVYVVFWRSLSQIRERNKAKQEVRRNSHTTDANS